MIVPGDNKPIQPAVGVAVPQIKPEALPPPALRALIREISSNEIDTFELAPELLRLLDDAPEIHYTTFLARLSSNTSIKNFSVALHDDEGTTPSPSEQDEALIASIFNAIAINPYIELEHIDIRINYMQFRIAQENCLALTAKANLLKSFLYAPLEPKTGEVSCAAIINTLNAHCPQLRQLTFGQHELTLNEANTTAIAQLLMEHKHLETVSLQDWHAGELQDLVFLLLLDQRMQINSLEIIIKEVEGEADKPTKQHEVFHFSPRTKGLVVAEILAEMKEEIFGVAPPSYIEQIELDNHDEAKTIIKCHITEESDPFAKCAPVLALIDHYLFEGEHDRAKATLELMPTDGERLVETLGSLASQRIQVERAHSLCSGEKRSAEAAFHVVPEDREPNTAPAEKKATMPHPSRS